MRTDTATVLVDSLAVVVSDSDGASFDRCFISRRRPMNADQPSEGPALLPIC